MECDQVQVIETILSIKQYTGYDDDVMQALQNRAVAAAVLDAEQRNTSDQISESLKKLSTAAELLNLAFLATQGLPSSSHIVDLMSSYQRFATDCKIECSLLEVSSLKALSYHHKAMQMQQMKNPRSAFMFVRSSGDIAKEMGIISWNMVEKTSIMYTLAEKAIEDTVNDDGFSAKKKAEIQELIHRLQVNRVTSEAHTSELSSQNKEAAKEGERAAGQIDTAKDQAYALALVSVGLRITTIERVRKTWSEIHRLCLALAEISKHRPPKIEGDEENFASLIIQSWYSWLALCKIIHNAQRVATEVLGIMDALVSNLSTEQEANDRFPALVAKLDEQLHEDFKELQGEPKADQ